MKEGKPRSTITWFYYDGLDEATAFYGETLGLEQALDAGWAKVYRTTGGAFVGLVDAREGVGACRTQETNAVLLTLVVDDVSAWYERLAVSGTKLEGEIKTLEEVRIRTFFLSDPGGYSIEIQEFLDPKDRAMFH